AETIVRKAPPTSSTQASSSVTAAIASIGRLRNSTPITAYRTPIKRTRKNPLQSRVQKAPTSCATPAMISSTPIVNIVASDEMNGAAIANIPNATRAMPRINSQIQRPRIASSSCRSSRRNRATSTPLASVLMA
ncbi:hypothetical protein HK102_012405, partial [Quaeritorhiza haematococci]